MKVEGKGVRGEVLAAEQMLVDAYELVLSGWCQRGLAQDEYGRPAEPASVFARRWSASGAIERVWRRWPEGEADAVAAFERANLALAAAVQGVPQQWNDDPDRHQSQVLDALAEAIFLLSVEDADAALRLTGDVVVLDPGPSAPLP